MRRPARGTRDHEQRGEHRGRYAHHVVRDSREPVEVREHFLHVPHYGLETLGDIEHLGGAGVLRQVARDFLDNLVARIGDGVDRVAEADDDFLVLDAAADVSLGLVRIVVALLDLERDFIGTAMLGAAQRADGAGDGRVHVRTGTGDHATGEGRCVELVLCIQDQRGVHRFFPQCRRLLAMQKMQEVTTDRVVIGLDFDAGAVMAVVIPVEQHRTQRGHQAVGDVARARGVVVVFFRQHAAQRRDARAHHIHRMRRRRQPLEHGLHVRGQATQCLQLLLVGLQFCGGRQLAVYQQVCDFFEFAGVGDVEDVIPTIVQVIASLADGAQCGVTRSDARQGDGFLRLEASCLLFAHACAPLLSWAVARGDCRLWLFVSGDAYFDFCCANSASSFCSKSW